MRKELNQKVKIRSLKSETETFDSKVKESDKTQVTSLLYYLSALLE